MVRYIFNRRKKRTRAKRFVHSKFTAIANEEEYKSIRKYYSENIHITRSIDEQLCKMSTKWCSLPQKRRYELIHTGIGVRALFDYAETGEFVG